MKTLSMTATSATLILVAGMHPAEAVTVFTDRTAWEEAVSGNSITTDTFSTPQSGGQSLVLDSSTQVTGISSVWSSGKFSTSTPSLSQSVGFEFPTPILGFGADFYSTTSNGGLTVSGLFDRILDVDTVVFSEYLNRQGTGFLGLVADTPFNSISFAMQSPPLAVSATNETFQMDNLSFASKLGQIDPSSPAELPNNSDTKDTGEVTPLTGTESKSVPEPASVLDLVIMGVLGTCSILKRYTQ